MSTSPPASPPSLFTADIASLQHALTTGTTTSTDLATSYLHRISSYDHRGPSLNSIPLLNPHIYAEAAASDDRHARHAPLSPLDGIPFTVKDSYKVCGMTVASGSPAFQDLVATDHAFTVNRLRAAGAVLVGKTNMCPMAAGGMQRGVYGRAESPYNADYLAAAFASGSSNGSGVATASAFAAFGMGEETVSSGRSPASNNAVVAYTPSRGALSICGNWPLYLTCDVVVPHARSVRDLLAVLDVIAVEDDVVQGDFWRDQKFIECPRVWQGRPKTLCELARKRNLKGCRIAVPSMYIGGKQIEGGVPVTTCPEVIELYQRAKKDLEGLGATVIEVDEFPVVEKYELANGTTTTQELSEQHSLPAGWHTIERSMMIAYAWEQFLQDNDDVNIASFKSVDDHQIYPAYPSDDPQVRYSEPTNRIHYEKLRSFIDVAESAHAGEGFNPRKAVMSIPNLDKALNALEAIRKTYFEDWLKDGSYDFVAFPACGDVGKSDADINYESAEYAWKDGVKYSNGNRALRHVGIPSVTVPMGNMKQKGMPVGLTFLAKSGGDMELLEMAYTYEQATQMRTSPKLTPELNSDRDIFASSKTSSEGAVRKARPELKIEKCTATPSSPGNRGKVRINIHGCITFAKSSSEDSTEDKPKLEIFVDAQTISEEKIVLQQCHGSMCGRSVFDFRCSVVVPEPPRQDPKNRVAARRKIARDSNIVVVLAREGNEGRRSGFMKLL